MTFDTSKVHKEIQSETLATVRALRDQLRERAPYVTGRYSRSFRFRMQKKQGTIASGVIFNNQPYATAIEGGIEPKSEHPWSVYARDSSKKGLIFYKGKIWSAKAPGGTIDPIVVDNPLFSLAFAIRISDAIVRGLS